MDLYAAPDLSLELTTICIVSRDGAIAIEAIVASDPNILADCLARYPPRLVRRGFEAGPLSEWLVRGLSRHGFDPILIVTRHVRAALSARVAKTDRSDARRMANLLRMEWFPPVHVKSLDAREHRALLAAPSIPMRRLKDIENSVRGPLRELGIRLASVLRGRWHAKVAKQATDIQL